MSEFIIGKVHNIEVRIVSFADGKAVQLHQDGIITQLTTHDANTLSILLMKATHATARIPENKAPIPWTTREKK